MQDHLVFFELEALLVVTGLDSKRLQTKRLGLLISR
jgi:hypothetical protein